MNAYDQHRAECRPCRDLAKKWAPVQKHVTVAPPKPFELVAGLGEEIHQAHSRANAARDALSGEDPTSVAAAHARGFLEQAQSEERAFAESKRKWVSWIDAHPDLAQKPITARCKHPIDRGFPSCWDGEEGIYRRDEGDDDF